MRFRPSLTIALMVSVCAFGTTQADVLTMPDTAPAQKVVKGMYMDLPARGLSMAQVERDFGNPRRKQSPVGEPPITRWVYDDYTVYFEYKYVIHSVVND